MKKHLFTLIAIIGIQTAFSQTRNYILYKEYDPDFWVELKFDSPFGFDYYYIDIDDDGSFDVAYSIWGEDHFTISQMGTHNGWEACNYRLRSRGLSFYNFFYDLSTPLNDTSLFWDNVILPEANTYPPDTSRYKTALMYQTGEDLYYGWAEFEEFIGSYDPVHPRFYFHIVRTCFCAIPNYPLRWGQTSLSDGFEDTEAVTFANIYPNPTSGLISITGETLKNAEVLNLLGQRVATVSGESEILQIDIAELPAGVYFVNITNEEGRKCVRKVVKE